MIDAAAYERDGYAVLPNLFSAGEVADLIAEVEAIAAGERGDVPGLGALDPDRPAMEQVLALHFPHKLSDRILNLVKDERVTAALTAVLGPDVKCMQSMMFVKRAGKPGQAWHQDEHFIATRDRSLVGVWIALDDATIENGCLWLHPGSHHHGILWPTRDHGDARFDVTEAAYDFPYDEDGGIAVEVPAGSVVMFDGYLLHRSLPNRAKAGYRRAIVNHYMNARSLLPWSHGEVRTPREDLRDFILVSGEDPYAWKGMEEVTKPFLRAEASGQSAS